MRIIQVFLFIAVLVLISRISLGKKRFYAFLKVRKIKLKYYRSGYHLECSGDKLRSQISACLPDIPEDEITQEFLETMTLQKGLDFKLSKLAKQIENDLPFELLRSGYQGKTYFLGMVSQKEVILALADFVVYIQKQEGNNIKDPDEVVRDITMKYY